MPRSPARGSYAERPDCAFLNLQMRALGGLVVVGLEPTVGRGILVYRVVDNEVAECWEFNADGRDSTDGF